MIEFSQRDSRIEEECLRGLPSQPNVARYIAQHLRDNGGSVLVARLIIQMLEGMIDGSVVAVPDVRRLSVDDMPDLLDRVSRANTDPRKNERLARLNARFFERSEPHLDGMDVLFRKPMAIREESRGRFLGICNCAMAMLVGVKINPHQKAA